MALRKTPDGRLGKSNQAVRGVMICARQMDLEKTSNKSNNRLVVPFRWPYVFIYDASPCGLMIKVAGMPLFDMNTGGT